MEHTGVFNSLYFFHIINSFTWYACDKFGFCHAFHPISMFDLHFHINASFYGENE